MRLANWVVVVATALSLSLLATTAGAQGGSDPTFEYVTQATDTRVSIVGPTEAIVSVDVTYAGELLEDPSGRPVSDATVRFSTGGPSFASATTGPDGKWSQKFRFTGAGTFNLQVTYDGRDGVHNPDSDSVRVVVKSRAILVPSLVTVERGGVAVLRGQALGDQGVALANEPVSLSAFGRVDNVRSDARGNFTFLVQVPSTQPLGDVQATYTAGGFDVLQTLRVTTRATLTLDAPARWPLGTDAPARLQILDRQGQPIEGIALALTASGPNGNARTTTGFTDSRGTAFISFPAHAGEGAYRLTAQPGLDSFVTAPPAEATTRFGVAKAAWTIPDPILRGEAVEVQVALTIGGFPVDGAEGTLVLQGTSMGVTDSGGVARFVASIPPSADLGPGKAVARFHSLKLEFEHALRIVSKTTLKLDAPATFTPGQTLQVNATLLDDAGAPVTGLPIRLTATSTTWDRETRASTGGGQGVAVLQLNTTDAPASNLALTAEFLGDARYLSSQAQASVTYAPPPSGLTFDIQAVKAYAVPGGAAVGMMGLVVLGTVAYRKRRANFARRQAQGGAAALATPAAVAPRPDEPPVDIALPDIEPDLPRVWGHGEPLRLSVQTTAPAPGGRAIVVEGGQQPQTVVLEGAGTGTLTLPGLTSGEYTLRAAPQGWTGASPGEMRVRIVEYREEIAREFETFLERARAIAPDLGRQATPREVEWTLAPQLPPQTAQALSEVALGMELANWSHHNVTRDEYVRFLRAVNAITPHLVAPSAPEADAEAAQADDATADPERSGGDG